MYAKYFDLKQEPFSIAPDPRYLFMSERHREALAHLLYGIHGGGGFVLLTGEIGAGKTTVCRCFLEQIPRRCNVAYIFNPKQTVVELMRSICDEFRIPYQLRPDGGATVKDFVDPLNEFLLRTHAVGQNNVLIIDEAQNLSVDVLEQLRLLTNLETNERKLLQIILIGQPELRTMLARPELEQLAQRVIARFHLQPLSETETSQYIWHRLCVAGQDREPLFDVEAIERIHFHTQGVPRRINLLCDRALLGAYASSHRVVDRAIVDRAAMEVFDTPLIPERKAWWRRASSWSLAATLLLATSVGLLAWRQAASHLAANVVADVVGAAAVLPAASGSMSSPAGHRTGSSPVLSPASAQTWMSQLAQAKHSQAAAWADLGTMWKLSGVVNASDDISCASLHDTSVRCFSSDMGLGLIRQLNRPCVLKLAPSPQSEPVYAVLSGLGPNTAVLRIAGQTGRVSLDALSRMWQGEFITLWRVPPGYRGALEVGRSGVDVDWLGGALARIDGSATPLAPQTFGAELRDRVTAFQVAHGLKPDGIAGSTTLMLLNRTAGVDEPVLQDAG